MLILANIWGWLTLHWRYIIIGLAILIVGVAMLKMCSHKPKLNEAQIQKAQAAQAKADREAMIEVLAESDVAEQQINTDTREGERQKLEAFAKARAAARSMTNDELAAELEARK